MKKSHSQLKPALEKLAAFVAFIILAIIVLPTACDHSSDSEDSVSGSRITPSEQHVRLDASPQEFVLGWEIENPQAGHTPILRKEGSAPWLHLLGPVRDGYRLSVDANRGAAREATLRLTYADAAVQQITVWQAEGSDTPEPNPDPDPKPDPDPTPSVGTYRTGWAELPREVENPDYYYAHHLTDLKMGGHQARNYTVCFSAEHHCPVWVAAPRHTAYEGETGRTDAYQPDPQIPINLQYNSKSSGGGCNKGHMLGSAERTASRTTNQQVFYYTNIAPQYMANFNTGGGAWNLLEDHVDKLVCADTTYVVIGCYFDRYTDKRGHTAEPKKIEFGDRDDVSCPTMFYYALLRTKRGNTGKSVYDCSADELQCVAFVRSHKTPKKSAVDRNDLISIAELEALTGHTFFANVEQAPKEEYNPSDWNL